MGGRLGGRAVGWVGGWVGGRAGAFPRPLASRWSGRAFFSGCVGSWAHGRFVSACVCVCAFVNLRRQLRALELGMPCGGTCKRRMLLAIATGQSPPVRRHYVAGSLNQGLALSSPSATACCSLAVKPRGSLVPDGRERRRWIQTFVGKGVREPSSTVLQVQARQQAGTQDGVASASPAASRNPGRQA